MVIYGALGLMLFASALQRAGVTTVTALVFGIETVLPSAIGVIFLETGTARAWPLALVGFITAPSAQRFSRAAEPALPSAEGSTRHRHRHRMSDARR